MRNARIINVWLISLLLTMIVVIISLLITRNNYRTNQEKFENILTDTTVTDFFLSEANQVSYEIDGAYQDLMLSPLCTDCDQTLSNMYNQNSMLVVDAPPEICNMEVERCIIYEFDPFGIGLFSKQKLLRSEI